MDYSTIKVCIYTWDTNKWRYCWTNIHGLGDFHSWLNTARSMTRWRDGNTIDETQNYDGSLTLILKNNGNNVNKYICKISDTADEHERR